MLQLIFKKRYLLAASLILSACASTPKLQRQPLETCLPAPGSDSFACVDKAGKQIERKPDEMRGYVCFPVDQLSIYFQGCDQ